MFIIILLGIIIGIAVSIITFIVKMNKEMDVIKRYSDELDIQIEKINKK
jgi:MFS superfamily sulfate permease-like transporter